MILAAKLGIGGLITLITIILFGFLMFPELIKGQIIKMVNLKPGADIREMFLDVPFGLDFNIYIFSVQNPDEVQKGGKPILKEMGPFCYEEWKKKINVEDNEEDDTISYQPVDTFYERHGLDGCADLNTEVTIPHPLILGMVNAVLRAKPGAVTLINKAIKSIFSNPNTLFITVKAKDLLFEGVSISCGVKDFAGKAICSTLKAEPSLKHITDDELAFSFLWPKNGTAGKQLTAIRGTKDYHDVGRIVKYDGQPKMSVWNVTKCDQYQGTDGTIFPPLLKKEQGVVSFAPDLCRSLGATYSGKTEYNGISVKIFTASLGDQSKNADEKCYCTTPTTCLKKGLMDLYKCANIPIYVSLPHFYDSHQIYLDGVDGLHPDPKKHGIKLLFELTTGSPLWARKRLQFNMPLEPNQKVDIFHNFTPTVLPIFWVEEGVALNKTMTKPLHTLFTVKKAVRIISILVLIGSIGVLAASAYLYMVKDNTLQFIKKVDGTRVSPTNGHDGEMEGVDNEAYVEKY